MDGINLPFNPQTLPRELKPFYISASDEELKEMLSSLSLNSMDELFSHIADEFKRDGSGELNLGPHLPYVELAKHVYSLSLKNKIKTSFLSHGLPNLDLPQVLGDICNIRGLTTAYTPYQPERSQGTLTALWIYSSAVSMLTGFEAINASLYDRSTCLYEALQTTTRLMRGKNTVLVSEGIHPNDLEVIQTLAKYTKLKIIPFPLDMADGTTHFASLDLFIKNHKDDLAGIAFPQVNHLGNLEDVDRLTDLATDLGIKKVAIVDPWLLGPSGLRPPSEYGRDKQGTDLLVAEGQHLALAPNLGGPGLGILGVRFNDKNKMDIRSTAGRYIGHAEDSEGKQCKTMVLSTREQHIRKEKATSNICSNQSFVALLAGAGLLAMGDQGLRERLNKSRGYAMEMAEELPQFEGVQLAYPETPFFYEFVLSTSLPAKDLLEKARAESIHLGIDISQSTGNPNHLLMSFNPSLNETDKDKLIGFFEKHFKRSQELTMPPALPGKDLRKTDPGIPQIEAERLLKYYQELGELNVSPDDAVYPLGSCTMKYNPYINDFAASLGGFTQTHPEAPQEDIQGCLEVLYEIQEQFKKITGLPGVTTQPVAGAQGELVGLKMFQAYHADKGEADKRDIILIPRSAHGTNPATATMAGFETIQVAGKEKGIQPIDADINGTIDIKQLKETVDKFGKRIAGIMITNPNTSGVFEVNFRLVADIIHGVGGLVYMDGANMNAIAGIVDLNKLGVDAVHNNLHKTWTIPHGGGGPGDAIVAVSDKLVDYLPGMQFVKENGEFKAQRPKKSIGSFHRHYGNFAHKIRAYTYIKALGEEGVVKMSSVAVLSARYLYQKLAGVYPMLPADGPHKKENPIMHEFIITLFKEDFDRLEKAGIKKSQVIPQIGKLFLDFGLHAPTVAFPEPFGLMIEPTESFTKAELDRFADVVFAIRNILEETPSVLISSPHFTPVKKVDEIKANKFLKLSENLVDLPSLPKEELSPKVIADKPISEIFSLIQNAHIKLQSKEQ